MPALLARQGRLPMRFALITIATARLRAIYFKHIDADYQYYSMPKVAASPLPAESSRYRRTLRLVIDGQMAAMMSAASRDIS